MTMTLELLETGLLQGLILALIAFGIMIPFRFLNFPDLSAEGSYPVGGAVCASLMIAGLSQIPAIIVGTLAGGIIASATAQVSLRLNVSSLLAGIIISTMAYSLNLRVMGKPNLALFGLTPFDFGAIPLILIVLSCMLPFGLFLYTDFGLRFRTIGSNIKFARSHGININKYITLGLFIAGSLFGLAGSLIVQMQQFMDVGMGVGMVIHGLASLMVGEALVGTTSIMRQLLAPLVGALVYQQIQGVALSIGLAPSDLKFFTGAIVIMLLAIQKGANQDRYL